MWFGDVRVGHVVGTAVETHQCCRLEGEVEFEGGWVWFIDFADGFLCYDGVWRVKRVQLGFEFFSEIV